jgi:hypothetical protein
LKMMQILQKAIMTNGVITVRIISIRANSLAIWDHSFKNLHILL